MCFLRLGLDGSVGSAFVGGDCCVAVPKISANWCSAAICLSPTWRKGAAGDGCFNAWINSNAACVAASFDDVAGILTWWGKNSTVSTILSLFVFVMWQQ
jgi:hypothetical protein